MRTFASKNQSKSKESCRYQRYLCSITWEVTKDENDDDNDDDMYMYLANMHPYEQDAYQVIVHASKVIE